MSDFNEKIQELKPLFEIQNGEINLEEQKEKEDQGYKDARQEMLRQKQEKEQEEAREEDLQQKQAHYEEVVEQIKENMPPVFAPEQEEKVEKNVSKRSKGRKGKKKVPNYILKNKRKQQMARDYKEKVEEPAHKAVVAAMTHFSNNQILNVGQLKTPDVFALKKEHEIQTRTIIKKHMFKKDEVITERIVTDKEQKTRKKADNAKLLKYYADDVTDMKVRARRRVPIDIKKRMDYKTFNDLSQFSSYMNDEEFRSLCNIYGKGMNRKKSKNNENYLKENIYPVMDTLTEKIMNIDVRSFDISSDRKLAEKAMDLESASGALEAYRRMLDRNPEYFDHLASQKTSLGVSYVEQLAKQMDQLSALTQYYRLRKLVIEDDHYISRANEELTFEEEKGDSVQIKRLKRMMRASYQAALNLERIVNGVDLPDMDFSKESQAHQDQLMLLPAVKMKLSGSEEDQLKQIKARFNEQANRDMAISNMESEKFFQAPEWMVDSLTLDMEKAKERAEKKEVDAMGSSMAVSNNFCAMELRRNSGRTKLYERRNTFKKEKLGGKWQSDPKFANARDKYLENICISDNWDRLNENFPSLYAYKMTDEEIMEMTELLTIQHNKEEWSKIAGDDQGKAFYEGAFKEMAMKMVFSVYAAARRLAETTSGAFLALHPVDLAAQMTTELKGLYATTMTITNLTTDENMLRVKKLFEENDMEGKYSFDAREMVDFGNICATGIYKSANIATALGNIITDSDYEEQCKLLFGDEEYFDKVVQPEFDKVTENGKLFNLENEYGHNYGKNAITSWYLARHPEFFTKEFLHKKDENGDFILQAAFSSALELTFQDGESAVRNLVKRGKIDLPSDEEFEKYEKHLKKNKYAKLRISDKDFDINSLEVEPAKPEKEIDIVLRSNVGVTGIKIKRKEIYEKRKKDPYGLNLVKNGMEELVYKDKNGVTHLRRGLGEL